MAVHHHPQAGRQGVAGRPDQADQTHRQALAYMQGQLQTEWIRSGTAVIYHQLGSTAQGRGRLDEAEDWYRKAHTISDGCGSFGGTG